MIPRIKNRKSRSSKLPENQSRTFFLKGGGGGLRAGLGQHDMTATSEV